MSKIKIGLYTGEKVIFGKEMDDFVKTHKLKEKDGKRYFE